MSEPGASAAPGAGISPGAASAFGPGATPAFGPGATPAFGPGAAPPPGTDPAPDTNPAPDPAAGVIPDERRRPLTPAERRRYHRNILVPRVGEAGQERIRAARVLVVGAGGLGSSAALHLAAAGVGRLGIADPDAVEISNLQRQILHRTADVGRAKTDSARETLTALNPDVEVLALPLRLTGANAPRVLRGWDVVVDGTDNFPARYLLGDACALLGVPLVHGAVLRTHGQVTVFDAAHGPCYRCLHPNPPPPGRVPSGAEAGVLGVLPGIIGSMQAAEALKLVIGGARPLIGRVLVLDAWGGAVTELPVRKNPACPTCGARPDQGLGPCGPTGPAGARPGPAGNDTPPGWPWEYLGRRPDGP